MNLNLHEEQEVTEKGNHTGYYTDRINVFFVSSFFFLSSHLKDNYGKQSLPIWVDKHKMNNGTICISNSKNGKKGNGDILGQSSYTIEINLILTQIRFL